MQAIQHENETAAMLDNQRKKSKSVESSNILSFFEKAGPKANNSMGKSNASSGGVQLLLKSNPTADSQLSMAICELIHSRALPFSLASDVKFRRVLTLAKNSSHEYKPPSRNQVAGELLDLNYEAYIKRNFIELMKDAEYFGISLFGDGATVRKSPLLNILGSSVYMPACCLEIVDCHDHMANGGKKDATFIANCFLPYIEKCSKNGKNFVDLALFDGAANMQKAGDILGIYHKRITCIHGAEHVMSLYFSDLFKLPQIRIFMKLCKLIYKHFGSGAMHAPYAIFQRFAKEHNGGRNIGLIRASDTRMGGHIIALVRLLRLKKALINTVTSAEYGRLKENLVSKIILDNTMWEHMLVIVRAIFPGLIILRLADSNKPAMDKLYHYVRRMDQYLERSTTLLDTIPKIGDDDKFPYRKYFSRYLSILSVSNEANKDSSADESELEMDDLGVVPDFEGLSDAFMKCWKKRREKLIHDYSISGWLLNPMEEVFNDARASCKGEHKFAMERLFRKLFQYDVENNESMDEMLDKFWDEYEMFTSKTGPSYGLRDHIWKSRDVMQGQSFMWHKKNSIGFTDYLGKFACIVTSKILGIGSAERNWGDVKHVKDNKRSHLSADRTKKQATIFGADCAARARMYRDAMQNNNKINDDDDKFSFWDDNDFDEELGFDMETFVQRNPKSGKPKRSVLCYMEEWEEEAVKSKNNIVGQHKLLEKYGGLQFLDPDTSKMVCVDDKKLHWSSTKGSRGYCLISYSIDYSQDTEQDNDDGMEYWYVEGPSCAIHQSIYDYYKEHPELGINVKKHPNDESEEEEEEEKEKEKSSVSSDSD